MKNIYTNTNEPRIHNKLRRTAKPSHTQIHTPINTRLPHPPATSIVAARSALEHGMLCLRMCPSDFYIKYSCMVNQSRMCVFMSGFRIANISRMRCLSRRIMQQQSGKREFGIIHFEHYEERAYEPTFMRTSHDA